MPGPSAHKEQEGAQTTLTLPLTVDLTFAFPAQATPLQKEQQQGMSQKGQERQGAKKG